VENNSRIEKITQYIYNINTHSTEEAETLCERIAILIEGRLVFIDTPKSIKMNYNRNYTLEVSTNFQINLKNLLIKIIFLD